MANPIALIAEGALSLVGVRTAREPAFTVLDRPAPGIEVRRYPPRTVAATLVEDLPERAARSEAFRRLARYIFGANRGARGIAMTAPVATRGAGRADIPMTVPVAMARPELGFAMRFYLPAGMTAATAPEPIDARVRIADVPEELLAALRWSGAMRDPAACHAAEARLLRALAATRWAATGPAESWFYDPPSTPGFLRRNEAVVGVAPRG